MSFLTRIRPSNLIILAALPFIIWLFATSPDYGRSLTAIVGVEKGSGAYVPGFLLVLCASLGGILAALTGGRGRGIWAAALSLIAGLALAISNLGLPFAASVLANAVDPFTSPLVVQGETPRRLTETALASLTLGLPRAIWGWFGLSVLFFVMMRVGVGLRRWGQRGLLLLNGVVLAYVGLVAYLGFAAGVATSIRAAVMAYVLAVLLGLIWVGLMQLRLSRRTAWIFGALVTAFIALAVWQFTQPRAVYVLIGTPEGKIGIVKGTPDSLIGAVQYGQFPGAASDDVQVRSFATGAEAVAGLAGAAGVSGVLVPNADVPAGQTGLWTVAALPDGHRAAGTGFAVLAILTGLLLLGGLAHRRHPLSVGAEFVIDTIRGIPMLVIVLYIGLPLAGAVKDASGGFIDPPNLLRGILAMALAYSAYLAEIFRSGINAVPVGQIEAARSLGLSRWMTARHVILPQAFRIIIPPLGNEFIAILKDTSLLSILSIRDITQRMREFQSASFLPFAPYNSAAIFYVLLTLVAASLVASVERKYHVVKR
jgi:polar amino acid transport system permease protein